MENSIEKVRQFWEENPLFSGESKFETGTKNFFEENRQVIINDAYTGKVDDRLFPKNKNIRLAEMGCGVGLLLVEFGLKEYQNITAIDLTKNALSISKKRCDIYGITADFSQQNIEQLGFKNKSFDHINCIGVIHHTPNTETCITEIARVLTEGGTANIAVYYKNFLLRIWPYIGWIGAILSKIRFSLPGRGRENIFSTRNTDELVKLYDGKDNPIGKSYARQEFIEMLSKDFYVTDTWQFFFPARSLPFKIPKWLHIWLAKFMGFMICASVVKKSDQ